MELTISIKEQSKLAFFIRLLEEFDFVEIIDMHEKSTTIPEEHAQLLNERLEKIEAGLETFTSWDSIKQKYEKKEL